MDEFVNRNEELSQLNVLSNLDGLLVLIGRRRIGKTSLISKWLGDKTHLYSQAIQGTSELQIDQVVGDFSQKIEFPIYPKTWTEFFNLFDLLEEKFIICLDEFPYLVKSDPNLPSIIQKWLDHKNKKKHLLVLTGSSTKMMTQSFLDSNSPLYGRAKMTMYLKPISYDYFCKYLNFKKEDENAFRLFSMTGGIPKYWENLNLIKLLKRTEEITPLDAADSLFFGNSPLLEGEVFRFLSDEKIEGLAPISVLEAIARGASKPSEVASRMGIPQSQLYKIFQQLLVTNLIVKEIPFGASANSNKIVNLRIKDPSTLCWFKLASVHGARWQNYSNEQKNKLIDDIVGHVFEDFVRDSFNGVSRYWDSRVELDFIQDNENVLHIAEIKWHYISKKEQLRLLWELENKLKNFKLLYSSPYKNKKIILKLFDRGFLKTGKELVSQEFKI